MYRIILYLLIVLLSCSAISYADEPSAVMANVNGSPITSVDVDEEVSRAIPQTLFHRNVSPERMETFKKEAVERLIDRELQFQEATAQGIKTEKSEIKDKVEEIKKRFRSNSEFKEALKKNNKTIKNLEALLEKDLSIEKVFQKEVEDKIKSNDDEAKAHYEANLQRYQEMEQVKLRHIMIKFDKDEGQGARDKEQVAQVASDKGQEARDKGQVASGKSKITRSKEEARARAVEILAKLKDGGDFASIAYESSDDPYRVKGGDLGYVHRGRIIQEIEDAAFVLNVGEVMGPVETTEGFYIIKVEDHKQEKQLSFDEVKDRIKKELERKRREEKRKEWLSALRAKAKIEYAVGKEQGVSSKE